MPTTPRARKQKPSIPIADRIRPRTDKTRRLSADLALALVVGWRQGYEFGDLFPTPHNLYEIGDIIQFFIEPMLHRDREYGGPRAAAALHWIAVVRLRNYGEITRLITDRQMHEGIWEEATGVPCDLGSRYRERANRDARDVLRLLGLLRFTKAQNGLVVTLIVDSILRVGADAVVDAMRRRHGPRGFKARMEKLGFEVGKEQADLVGKEQADLVGPRVPTRRNQREKHVREAEGETE